MRVEVITPSADPDHGGFGGRVHALVSMFAQFAEVRVVRTDWFAGPEVPGVQYIDFPVHDTALTRLRRLRTYYRTDFPRRVPGDAPDLVVVESLDRLGLRPRGAPIILDEHNVYWKLLEYELASTPFFGGWMGRRAFLRRRLIPRLMDRAKRFELQAIRRAARTLATSEEDRRLILAECPEATEKVAVLPNCVDAARVQALPDSPESRTVLFVGDFGYGPNREAAAFIGQTLAPHIPDARFRLVGANPPAEAVGRNVVATGRVPDLSEALREATVCIAPLSHGSGTRVKILTYLAAGRAVVATSKACEGLPLRDDVDVLIRDDPEAFALATRELLDDPDRRRRLADGGRKLIEARFDWRVHVGRLRALATDALTRPAGDGFPNSPGALPGSEPSLVD